MSTHLGVGSFLGKVPRLTPAKVVALLAAMLGAVVALGVAASAASADSEGTFSNTAGITINDAAKNCVGGVGQPNETPGTATPYPSEIDVSGLRGPVSDVNVTLTGLSHNFPDDIGVLLVGPEGQTTILMTDVGGSDRTPASAVNLTLDDAASGALPDGGQLSSGTYQPTRGTVDTLNCHAPSSFPASAPAGPYGSSLSVFNGTNANGTWQLYVIDDTVGDRGSITGWSLTIKTDTTEPRVTINQASGQVDPTSDSPIHFTAVFTEPVTDFTDSDVILSGTAGATTADVTEIAPKDGTTYDVAVSGMTTDGTVIASIPANAAKDIALNTSSSSTSTDNTVTFIANSPPVANDENATTNEDTTANIDVLANDTDADEDPLTIVGVDSPFNGTASIDDNDTPNDPADDSITYTPDANYSGSDSFTYTIGDGKGETDSATVALTVNAVNDAPVLANIESGALTYTENDGPKAITSALTLADVDNTNLSGATVQITGNYQSSQDVLAFTDQNGISGSWDATTGTLTLTGSASLANYQSALRSVTYENMSEDPSTLARTVSFKVDDGQAQNNLSNAQTRDITLNALNDAPTVEVAAGGSCGTNDRSGQINLIVNDPDGLTQTGSLKLSATDTSNKNLVPTSNVTFGGSGASRTLTATALSGKNGTATITVTVTDADKATGKVAFTLQAGGNSNDTLTGSSATDILLGQNGDDTLSGLGGNDLMCGARGNDRLTGGLGADRFEGGSGNDRATDFTPSQGDTKDNTVETF
jgi:subtilisin-like proprotein convertase family protein